MAFKLMGSAGLGEAAAKINPQGDYYYYYY